MLLVYDIDMMYLCDATMWISVVWVFRGNFRGEEFHKHEAFTSHELTLDLFAKGQRLLTGRKCVKLLILQKNVCIFKW